MLRGVEQRRAKRRVARRSAYLAAPRPDEEADPGTQKRPEIKHIVVLMMENHSYDNYLGMLQGRGDGFTLKADGTPDVANKDLDGTTVAATRAPGTKQVGGVPTQSWNASHIQWNDGPCDGFVRSIEETLPDQRKHADVAMRYYTEEDLPFYYGLAKTFPLADRWFSSCLGPTFPNRRFLTAGTAHGLIDDLPFGMVDYPKAGTIFDLLTAHGISWANYHNVPPGKIAAKRVLRARGVAFVRVVGAVLSALFPALKQSVESKLQVTADLYPLGTLRSLNHLRTMPQFFADARAGRLPSVSIVDPDFGQWSEENPQDVRHGESFACQVVNAVMHGKGWPGTLLVWTYDEHGGYYDHVCPPAAPEPDDVPGANPMKRFWFVNLMLRFTKYAKQIEAIDAGTPHYDRLGFRVPTVIVSPYARRDYVTSTVSDHTSILRLIEEQWNLPALTRRDAAATFPLDALDFDNPPAFLEPPPLPDSAIHITI
jgi:phospholipase C